MAQASKYNLQITHGGMGDTIAATPAIRYLSNKAPNTQFSVIVPDYFVPLANRIMPLENVRYIGVTDAKADKKGVLIDWDAMAATNKNFHTTLRTHLTDHAFHTLADCHTDSVLDRMYPCITPVPKKRMVVLTTGFTARVRQWEPATTVNAVARLCLDMGYEVVWLGSSASRLSDKTSIPAYFGAIDYTLGRDLRDRTTLVQALDVINESTLVVGVDNGLLHLAGCTTTPVVAGYTNVHPSLRIPYGAEKRWTALIAPLTVCHNCQSSEYLDFVADYRECTRDKDATTCSRNITYKQWEQAIVERLDP